MRPHMAINLRRTSRFIETSIPGQDIAHTVNLIWALHSTSTNLDSQHTEHAHEFATVNLLLDDPDISIGPLPDDVSARSVLVHGALMFVAWAICSVIGSVATLQHWPWSIRAC